MKKLILYAPLLFIIGLFNSCEKKGIEIIPDYDKIYKTTFDQFPALKDANGEPIATKNLKKEELIEAMKRFNQLMEKHKSVLSAEEWINIVESTSVENKRKYFSSILYLNETGKIDKVKIQHSVSDKQTRKAIELLEEFSFTPAMDKAIAVKSQVAFLLDYYDKGFLNDPNTKWNFALAGNGKNTSAPLSNDSMFFVVVEEMPSPIGGIKGIQEKIVYPDIAKQNGIEGRVFIKAYIDEEGDVVKAEVMKGIGYGCDEAALNAVKQTKFKPGAQRGKKVKVQVAVPIVFKLQ